LFGYLTVISEPHVSYGTDHLESFKLWKKEVLGHLSGLNEANCET